MPEGDTIFRTARTLHRALAGHVVTRFYTVLPKLGRVDEDTPLAGRTIEEVVAQGKNLLIRFSGELVLWTHMLMSGSWHIYRHGERWQRGRQHLRILLETAEFVAVGFNVPIAELRTEAALRREPRLATLGPDLLAVDFDAAQAVQRLRKRPARGIGEALLDQRALAGIGNVFKSEVLFVGGVHPRTPVGALGDAELTALVEIARSQLAANTLPQSPDAVVTYTGQRRTTHRAEPHERLWVYGRGGKPCRTCATPIAMRKDGEGARLTFWCPRCQRAPSDEL